VGDVSGSGPRKDMWQTRRFGAANTDPADPLRIDPTFGVPKSTTRAILGLQAIYRRHAKFPLPGLGTVFNHELPDQFGDLVLGGSLTAGTLATRMGANMDAVLQQLPGFDCCSGAQEGCSKALNQLWNHLDLHTWPRLAHGAPHDFRLGMLGFAWLMTAPGQPVISYGQEIGFTGLCPSNMVIDTGDHGQELRSSCRQALEHQEFFRQDMFQGGPLLLGSSVRSINRMAYVGVRRPMASPPWEKDPMLERASPLHRMARRLISLRASCPVLARGATAWRSGETRPHGVLAYSRLHRPSGEERVVVPEEALVVLNPRPERVKVHQKLFEVDAEVNPIAGKEYISVLTDRIVETVRLDDKTYLAFDQPLDLPPYGFAIFMDQALVFKNASDGSIACHHPNPKPFENAASPSAGLWGSTSASGIGVSVSE